MISAVLKARFGKGSASPLARACTRWLLASLAVAALIWVAGLAGLIEVARRVHVDIPNALAIKLPLLQLKPQLIFAGESRTHYGVDPVVAANRLGKPRGYAVNIGYDAGEPLAVLAAARAEPDIFRNAALVVSTAPFLFNEGVKSAGVYPLDVAARLSVGEQFASFFPLRTGVMIRFVTDAFQTRVTQQLDIARTGPVLQALGVGELTSVASASKTPLSAHPHYTGWNLKGAKARYETSALCDLAPLVRKLTVVVPPWSVLQTADDLWKSYEGETVALLREAGQRCHFDVLHIASVPDLKPTDFADDMHVNASGVPIYTRYLVDQLKF